jgi:hypothetical protein
MAAYSMPPSSSNKKKYGSLVLRFINDEAIENFDYIFDWKIIDWLNFF